MTDKKHSVKIVREGDYMAEVSVELIYDETGWSPYLSLRDAEKPDEVREALRKGNIEKAGQILLLFLRTCLLRRREYLLHQTHAAEDCVRLPGISMNRNNIILLSFIILLGLPSVANANAGTPLMWATLFHLAVGNAFVGIIEGFVIAKIFHLKMAKSIGLLILANYTSAWIGSFVLYKRITDHLPLSINNIRIWLAAMVFAAYAFTIILELPFIALCFRGTTGWLGNSIKASFLAQTLTYLLLIVWYWLASGTSLLTGMHIVPLSGIRLPEQVLVYYISVKDGDVYLRHLSMQDDRKIFSLNSSNRNDRLFARPSQGDAQKFDIVARLETGDHKNPSFKIVRSSLPVLAATEYRSTLTPPAYEGTWFNFGRVPLLDASASDSWEIWTGFWPVEGMEGTDKKTGKKFHFSLETPFAAWPVRNAVKLPDDKVVFQLGDDQICLLDIETNKIALVSNGRGPVPIIEERHGGVER